MTPLLALRLVAHVDGAHGTVEGELWADGPVELANPLDRLPLPTSDRVLLRTFPRSVDPGELTWTTLEPGHWRFHARLPVRYGDVGTVPGVGTFGDGGWYPLPVDEAGRAREATWDVHVDGPGTLVVNGAVGGDWQGRADRVALAALPTATVTQVAPWLRLVETGRPRPHLRRELEALAAAWPEGVEPVTVVEDRDLLRLARAAPGMVYLSDRAFRVSPGLDAFHREPVWKALLAAAWPSSDPWVRDFAGAALGSAPRAASVSRTFAWLAWNPVVDAILHDGTTPFYTDLFDEPFPEHPSALDARDDRIPGRAAAAQVDELLGDGSALHVLRDPRPLPDAARAHGVPDAVVDGWSLPYASRQDYVATAHDVRRDAPADAPVEAVLVEQHGEDTPWVAAPGATLPVDAPVRLHGAFDDSPTSNNSWPPKWSLIASAGVDDINPTNQSFIAWGELTLRKQGDSRNLWFGDLVHDDQDLLGVDVGYVRYVGPLVDRRSRTHRLSFVGGPALLDPAFRPTAAGAVALGGSVAYTWVTKTAQETALTGHRLTLALSGGFIPGSTEAWASATATGVKLVPLDLRDVVALRGKVGWASGDVEHRLLTLGGSTDLRSLPSSVGLSNERVEATAEYRWTVIRHASVPVPLAWLSEVRLVPGLEAGLGWRGADAYVATGASLGAYVVYDGLGALPQMLGVAAAVPLWTEGLSGEGVQLYVDFDHDF